GTSATSLSRRRSASCCRIRSWRSTTCSTASTGSSPGSSSIPNECGATSTRATASSSAIASCSRSSSPVWRATRRTAPCRRTPCARGRRRGTSPSSFAKTASSPPAPTSTQPSISTQLSAMSTPSSTACTPSSERRNQFMPEAALHVGSGKVRELYALDDDRLLLVASDRISTFDVVLPTEIPDKGRVLTGLSAFWFARTRDICPNHLLALRADGRSTQCRRLELLPIDCVVRGYLSGSGWKDY